MKILIKNGSVLYKGKIREGDVLVSDGRIKKIAANIDVKADKVIDAIGLTVLPAFIDMHTHLRDPGFEHKEDIFSGGRAAVAGGYAAVCCMPNTDPPVDNVPLVSYVVNKAKAADQARVYPICAISKGLKGEELAELGLMREAGAVAASDDGNPVVSAGLMRTALEYAKTADILLISHCEERSLSEGGSVNEGYNATIAGLKGIPRAAEEVMTARELILAEELNTRVHIAHVSTAGAVQLIREAKARGVRVTCEACPHHFAATDDMILDYNTSAKINPPLREKRDIKAVMQGLADGTIDVIATDHAPHNRGVKNVEFASAAFGTTGLETAFALGYTYLVKSNVLDLAALSALMSKRPAEILGITDTGELLEGNRADIAIVDLKCIWTVDKDKMFSKSKNTLFDKWDLTGRVRYTLVDGDVKFESSESPASHD